MRNPNNCLSTLQSAGFNYEDACALRRISMTLHRWHELECGDSNDYRSVTIARGRKTKDGFVYDDNGKPWLEIHPHRGDTRTIYSSTHDRERGAFKRLAAIMKRYPSFCSYVQGDPRGCALYILRPGDLRYAPDRHAHTPQCAVMNAVEGWDHGPCNCSKPESSDFREWLSANYSRGIGVCK